MTPPPQKKKNQFKKKKIKNAPNFFLTLFTLSPLFLVYSPPKVSQSPPPGEILQETLKIYEYSTARGFFLHVNIIIVAPILYLALSAIYIHV